MCLSSVRSCMRSRCRQDYREGVGRDQGRRTGHLHGAFGALGYWRRVHWMERRSVPIIVQDIFRGGRVLKPREGFCHVARLFISSGSKGRWGVPWIDRAGRCWIVIPLFYRYYCTLVLLLVHGLCKSMDIMNFRLGSFDELECSCNDKTYFVRTVLDFPKRKA